MKRRYYNLRKMARLHAIIHERTKKNDFAITFLNQITY